MTATIAIVGFGAIGGIVAGSLTALGRYDVVVCVKSPIDRVVVERPCDTVDVPIRALTDPAEAGRVDWVLLSTKVHQTPSAASWLTRLCSSKTRVATLQNGIAPTERLAPFVGGAVVVPTIVYYSGERLAPGRVRFRAAGEHELAVQDDQDGRALAALFHGSPLRVLLSADLATLAWRKLLMNSVANPITALTLQRLTVFRREDVQALCLAALEEAAAVGRADGANFVADEAARTLAALLIYPAEVGTSMYLDRLAGRSLEIEALTGAIVARGQLHGIRTPLNTTLLTLLRASTDRGDPLPP